ncbi:hypothetical protein DEU56DRAFT_732367, partial [Suillus clintonianus]|uniref:uncharacterized protein n=1 Tax=Suillus clintonianus TaxID=1904413 RepID=UPI001B88478D
MLPRATFAPQHAQFSTHMLRLRSKKVVPLLLGDALPRPDQSEEENELHCRAMMLLFKPWREFSDLKSDVESWVDAFEKETFPSRLLAIIKNMNVENECKDARDAHAVLVR